MTQLRTKAGDVLINSRELIERMVELGILGELNFRAIEAVTDIVLEMDSSPLKAGCEKASVAISDGVCEAGPSAGDERGFGVIEKLHDELMRHAPRPVEIEREPEPLVLSAGEEGAEQLASRDVERGRNHRASGVQAHPQCATDAAGDGRCITLGDVQRCGMESLGDVTLEAELAREMTLGDLVFLVDLRAKWKRDAILELSRRLREVAKI